MATSAEMPWAGVVTADHAARRRGGPRWLSWRRRYLWQHPPVTSGPCFPTRTYALLYSLDLSPGSWLPVPGAIMLPLDASGFCTIIDPSPGPERRFYRVEINR